MTRENEYWMSGTGENEFRGSGVIVTGLRMVVKVYS